MRNFIFLLLALPSISFAMPNEPVICRSNDGKVEAQLSTWRNSGNPDGDGVRAVVNGILYTGYDEKNTAYMGQYWSDAEGLRMKIMIPGSAFGEYESAALVFVTHFAEPGGYPATGTLEIKAQEIADLPWQTVAKKPATCWP